MTQGDAIVQEAMATGTVMADALRSRLASYAAEKFSLEEQVKALTEKTAALTKELDELKGAKNAVADSVPNP